MQEEPQNGKWSEWISNEGNTVDESPLGFIGSREAPCLVKYRDSKISSGLVKQYAFSMMLIDSDIMKYRYWIPDTQTQTEDSIDTEKEKDMDIWTDKDEEELNKLMVKKMLIESENKKKLESVVSSIHCYNITVGELTSEMITYADELIEALQPYRKQK